MCRDLRDKARKGSIHARALSHAFVPLSFKSEYILGIERVKHHKRRASTNKRYREKEREKTQQKKRRQQRNKKTTTTTATATATQSKHTIQREPCRNWQCKWINRTIVVLPKVRKKIELRHFLCFLFFFFYWTNIGLVDWLWIIFECYSLIKTVSFGFCMLPLERKPSIENNDDTQQTIDYDSADESLLPWKKVKSLSFIQNNREQLVSLQVKHQFSFSFPFPRFLFICFHVCVFVCI